jgi:lactate dehydrogenase-like 2-hydroxyacid dehydrogenase
MKENLLDQETQSSDHVSNHVPLEWNPNKLLRN